MDNWDCYFYVIEQTFDCCVNIYTGGRMSLALSQLEYLNRRPWQLAWPINITPERFEVRTLIGLKGMSLFLNE